MMSWQWTFLMVTFVSLFSTVNPLGAAPIFISNPLISSDRTCRLKAAKKIAFTVLAFLTAFACMGEILFRFMGISVEAFQLAGGIFIFMVALEMMQGKVSQKTQDPSDTDDFTITPLAIPLLAGPGSITMVMVLMSKTRDFWQGLVVWGLILLVTLLTYFILRYSHILTRYLNASGIKIMNKLMGLLMGAIAVQFWIDGLGKLGGKYFQ